MASQTETIKEFLVALGFKVDENGLGKFGKAIQGATKLTGELGAVVGATVVATVGVVAKVAEAMEKLYYVSQRTGSSIASIRGFDFAISNLGGSAEGAESSLENLGHFIRSYPGSASFLEKLGVDPSHVKDSEKAMIDLGHTFQRMPFWQAQAYGNVLGIDEKTLLALQTGEYGRYIDDYNKRVAAAGVNAQRAGERGHDFMVALRGVEASAVVAATALEDRFAPALTWVLDLWDKVLQLDAKAITDPKGTLGGGLKLLFTNPMQFAKNYDASSLGQLELGRGGLGKKQPATAAPTDTRSTDEKRKYLQDYFVSQGWSAQAAAGIVKRLGIESGFDPSAHGDNGQAYGLGQLHKDWRQDFKATMGHDIYGSSIEEQAKFISMALKGETKSHDPDARIAGTALRSARTEDEGYAAFTNGFEKPAVAAGNGQIIQNNTYQINGAGDPNAVGAVVAQKQNDANKQLIRNIGGAVQ